MWITRGPNGLWLSKHKPEWEENIRAHRLIPKHMITPVNIREEFLFCRFQNWMLPCFGLQKDQLPKMGETIEITDFQGFILIN